MSHGTMVEATPSVPGQRPAVHKAVIIALIAICILSIVLLLQWGNLARLFGETCTAVFGDAVSGARCASGVNKIRLYALAFAVLPIILIAERWRPADPEQAPVSPGLLVDLLWFMIFPLMVIGLRTPFEDALVWAVGPTIANYQFGFIAALPSTAQLIVVIILSDFVAWGSHVIRHKVPMFWEFHKIHHSQTELNYFSTLRLHPGDQLAHSLIRFIPFTLLGLNTAFPAFLLWSTFLRIYEMFVHSNIRTSLGPLKYVLVTPQSHRIHHSAQVEHIDHNFGDAFAIWDFIFRTQCHDFNVYPKTDAGDPDCSNGTATSVRGAVATLGRELMYPLRVLSKRWRRQ